jgi:hypothetical protein
VDNRGATAGFKPDLCAACAFNGRFPGFPAEYAASRAAGLYPPSHGVIRTDPSLNPAVPTLAGELKNVAAVNPAELAAMKKELERMLKNMPLRRPAKGGQPLPAVKERMKALGYWWLERPRAKY